MGCNSACDECTDKDATADPAAHSGAQRVAADDNDGGDEIPGAKPGRPESMELDIVELDMQVVNTDDDHRASRV